MYSIIRSTATGYRAVSLNIIHQTLGCQALAGRWLQIYLTSAFLCIEQNIMGHQLRELQVHACVNIGYIPVWQEHSAEESRTWQLTGVYLRSSELTTTCKQRDKKAATR